MRGAAPVSAINRWPTLGNDQFDLGVLSSDIESYLGLDAGKTDDLACVVTRDEPRI